MTNAAVLLVEDNDINRDMLTRRLTRAGLTVISAADGKTALHRMRNDSPGVVLMDMTLPVLNGWRPVNRQRPIQRSHTFRSSLSRHTPWRLIGSER